MAAVAVGAAIVGAGIAIYGDISSASDQAGLDASKASIAQQQSAEIGAREQANEALRDQQAYRQKLQFGASYAASGKAGTGVGSQLEIQNQADLQNMMSNREATFQQYMLQQQAGIDTTLGNETQAAGTLNAVGAGLRGVGTIAGMAGTGSSGVGYGGTQSMGAYPSGSSGGYNLGVGSLGGG